MKKIKNQILKGIALIIICFFVVTKLYSQDNKIARQDSIYYGVTINLTPDYPEKARIVLNNLQTRLRLFLFIESVNNNENYCKTDSVVIIHLESDTFWELGLPPKSPPFFLIKAAIKSKNKKVLDRIEYLKFNSICEQKPKSIYKLIDYLEVYDEENICQIKIDSLGNFTLK